MSGVWIKGWYAQVPPNCTALCLHSASADEAWLNSVCPSIDPAHSQIINAKLWQGEIRSLDLMAWNAGCLLRMGTRVVSYISQLALNLLSVQPGSEGWSQSHQETEVLSQQYHAYLYQVSPKSKTFQHNFGTECLSAP